MGDEYRVGPLAPTMDPLRWMAVEAHRAIEEHVGHAWRMPVEMAITQKNGRGLAMCMAVQRDSPERGWEPVLVSIPREAFRTWKDKRVDDVIEELRERAQLAFEARTLPPWPRWSAMGVSA